MPRILHIEDDSTMSEMFGLFFKRFDFDLDQADTKAAALNRLSENEYDLLIVDQTLPDGSGMDVIKEMRRLGHESEVIIATGYCRLCLKSLPVVKHSLETPPLRDSVQTFETEPSLESAMEAMKYRVFRYMAKPLNFEELALEITGALETKALRDTLSQTTQDLKTNNDNLIRSEKRYRKLADLVPGILIETDSHGTLTYVNRHGLALTGLDKDSFRRRFHARTLFAQEDRARASAQLEAALEGNEIDGVEYQIHGQDGRLIPVVVRSYTSNSGQQLQGLCVVMFDISQMKRIEQELSAKESELEIAQKIETVGLVAGGIAHDFNNMLGVIRCHADMARLDLNPDHVLQADLNSIIGACSRAADLTRQLLTFGRREILAPRNLDLNEVVLSMESMIHNILRENITLEMNLCKELLCIYADPGQIEQVVMNLVVNARDAMPSGGKLTIETIAEKRENGEEERALLHVADTGSGMDHQTLSRVFEPFFTTKRKGEGTGLGLATVYRIVKNSGGEVRVFSEPDQGTKFALSFSRAGGTPFVSILPSPNMLELDGNETILVAEDQDSLRLIIERILRRHGYRVLLARDGVDALNKLENRTEPVHLLLTDLVMPQMNGRELAERATEEIPDIKIVYMSAYSDDTIIRETISENFELFISKPFSAKELGEKVRMVLDSDFVQ